MDAMNSEVTFQGWMNEIHRNSNSDMDRNFGIDDSDYDSDDNDSWRPTGGCY